MQANSFEAEGMAFPSLEEMWERSVVQKVQRDFDYLKRQTSMQEITNINPQSIASIDAALEEEGYRTEPLHCNVSNRDWMIVRKAVANAIH